MMVIRLLLSSLLAFAAFAQVAPDNLEWSGNISLNLKPNSRMALLTVDQNEPDGTVEYGVLIELSGEPSPAEFAFRGRLRAQRNSGVIVTTDRQVIAFATASGTEQKFPPAGSKVHGIVGLSVIKFVEPKTNEAAAKDLLSRYDRLPGRPRRGR